MIRAYFHIDNERSKESLEFAEYENFKIIDLDTTDDCAYSKALKELWQKEDLIILETDNVPTTKQLERIENCHALACSYLYYAKWEDNGQYYIMAGRYYNNVQQAAQLLRLNEIPYSVDYPDFSGLGFCKISLAAQKLIDPSVFDGVKWKDGLDKLISDELRKHFLSWHLHKEFVKHNHL